MLDSRIEQWASTALLRDNGAFALPADIRPIGQGKRAFGPALTVRTERGSVLAVHAAIREARAGEVLIIDAGGDPAQAVLGDILVTAAQRAGLRGIIVYGSVRDTYELPAFNMPVFASSRQACGPDRSAGGEVLGAIVCAAVTIRPGDWLMADDDGAAVVPAESAAQVFADARRKLEREASRLADIEAGRGTMPDLDAMIQRHGVIIHPRAPV